MLANLPAAISEGTFYITTEKVAAWDEAEQNAKDYADEAMTWGTF